MREASIKGYQRWRWKVWTIRNDKKINSVNAGVDKEEFTTSRDDFECVVRFFLSTDEKLLLGIFDWAKAY